LYETLYLVYIYIPNPTKKMISKGSYDTKDWSAVLAAENSVLPSQEYITFIYKYS